MNDLESGTGRPLLSQTVFYGDKDAFQRAWETAVVRSVITVAQATRDPIKSANRYLATPFLFSFLISLSIYLYL